MQAIDNYTAVDRKKWNINIMNVQFNNFIHLHYSDIYDIMIKKVSYDF